MTGIVPATIWMSGALVSFMLMAISGRELAAELSTFQILFFRSAIGLVVLMIAISFSGWVQVRTNKIGTHLIRNIAHYIGQYGWFFAISLIPLAQVFALEFTVPLWVAIFAPLMLRESLTRTRIAVITTGFIGILVILRPGVIPLEVGVISALIAAIGYALSHTLTKKLTNTDTPLSVLFYMTAFQLPMGAIPAFIDWTTPSTALWPWLFIVAITALSAHYCMARAFSHADAIVVIPMDFLRLPLIALIGFAAYGEPIDYWVLGGAGIIFIGILVNVHAEREPAKTD